jgi:hypothetical protein
LFNKVNKEINIILNGRGLADVEELADEEFVLISAKTLADHTAEVGTILFHEFAFHGLKPTASSTGELHRGAFHPHGRIDGIQIEVILGTSHPILGIITIEFWEMHFWKMAEVGMKLV